MIEPNDMEVNCNFTNNICTQTLCSFDVKLFVEKLNPGVLTNKENKQWNTNNKRVHWSMIVG